jgi:hypothetical protein
MPKLNKQKSKAGGSRKPGGSKAAADPNAKYKRKSSSGGVKRKKERSNHSLNPGFYFSIIFDLNKQKSSAERKIDGKKASSGSGPTMRTKSTINRLRMYKNFKPVRFIIHMGMANGFWLLGFTGNNLRYVG